MFAYIKEYAREMGVGDDERINACRRELGVLIGLKETGLSDYLKLSSPAAFRNSDFYFFVRGFGKKNIVYIIMALAALLVIVAGAVSFFSGGHEEKLSSAAVRDSTASAGLVAEAAELHRNHCNRCEFLLEHILQAVPDERLKRPPLLVIEIRL
ncbi:MAG: hypothetical protein RAO75_04240 [Candidatus Chlorobium antarcticum]|nr:hypothetical protein [Candidatus Chlorobium antarcticum]